MMMMTWFPRSFQVITVRPMVRDGLETRDIHADGTMTLPLKKKGRDLCGVRQTSISDTGAHLVWCKSNTAAT